MLIRLRPQAVSLVKAFAAAGDLALRRLDLQNQGLVPLQKLPEQRAACPVAAQRRLDGKMLKIGKRLRFPQKHVCQQLSILDRAEREKVRVLHCTQMILPRAPLVGREAGFVKGERRFKQRMGSADAFKVHV